MKEETGSKKNTLLLIVILIILLLIVAFGITKLSDDEGVTVTELKAYETTSTTCITKVETTTVTTTAVETQPQETIRLPIDEYDLYSSAALLMDKNGNTIYSLNEDEQIYPASLTKIMTAIVAIENIDNLDDTVQIPGDIYDYITQENASTAGFLSYETVSFKDLIYGALLPSGAECSLTLAVYVGGSEDMFVEMMNDKAAELGMNHTHFTNVCGLHNYDHYSTVSDLSILLNYALKNSSFRTVFTSSDYYTTTDCHPDGISLNSTMFSQLDSKYFEGGSFLGGKTGYTSEAGYCLASLAEINGSEYTLVTVGAGGEYIYDPQNVYDAQKIYQTLAAYQ